MMMMMCNDLMCTKKLTRSQLSLAHNAKVKTDMPEKKWCNLFNKGHIQTWRSQDFVWGALFCQKKLPTFFSHRPQRP